ncbi:MAG: GTPase [Candidatus Pacearchaeota archaeon]
MRIRYSFSSRKTGRIEGTSHHHIAFPRLVKEIIRTSDIILEILDARFIEKTRNKELEKYVLEEGRKLIFILNKADLIDINELKKNVDLSELKPYVLFSTKEKIGRSKLRTLLKIEAKRLHLPKGKKARIGIIGYPNTGKSSLINLLAGRASAGVSTKPGFTRGIQKIRFSKNIVLLDTPGVVPEREDFARGMGIIKKHAEIGVETYERVKNPDFVVAKLMQEYPNVFEKFYGINAEGDAEILLEELGRKRRFLAKGGKVDVDKTARIVLKDWQTGKIKPKA